MKKSKTPRPGRSGNTKKQAAQLARFIKSELGDDLEALLALRGVVRLMATRSRSSRRRN